MRNTTYTITYWNKEGKYQKEYNIIYNLFLRGHKKEEIKETENKQINSKIRKLGKFGNRLYRFYNDGNSFVYQNKKIIYDSLSSETALKNIEGEMDRLILEVWEFTIKEYPQEVVMQELKNDE